MSVAPGGHTRRFVVPKVQGDPAAARRMATAYRNLATAIRSAQAQAAHIAGNAASYWSGPGQRASEAPFHQTLHDAGRLAAVLDQVADALDELAAKLEHAEHHHRWSLHKLVAIGAVVTITVAAAVVTVGASTVVEAATAEAVVADATEASATAATAGAAASDSLFSSLAVLRSLQPLLDFVLPHLLQVEWSTGGVAAYDEFTRGSINWRDMGIAAASTAVGTEISGRVASSLAFSSPAIASAAQGGVWAGVAAADDGIVDHRIYLSDIGETFVLAGGGTAARDTMRDRDWIFHEKDPLREAMIAELDRPGRILDPEIAHEMAMLTPTTWEVRNGRIDLALHEQMGGHTIGAHIRVSEKQVMRRGARIGKATAFFSQDEARNAIAHTLKLNTAALRAFLRDDNQDTLRIYARLPNGVGYGYARRAKYAVVHRMVCVVLRKDTYGNAYVFTAFPMFPNYDCLRHTR